MIEIKLTFQTIIEAADTLAALAAALEDKTLHVEAAIPAKPAKPAKPEPKPEPKPAEPEEPVIEYPVLQKAVMELVSVSPEAVKEILHQFGLSTFKGSSPHIWNKALAALVAKRAELA